MRTDDLTPNATITALLGPTNTGKTHTAIERMCAHKTGVIGLPLRLLAREVYERVVQRKNRDLVALVTGEEKRIPERARYFVCTTEAMPLDRPFSFVCVDEIQLAGDRHRGHVFTDRLLHARGLNETLFLGSSTIELLLRRLVPEASVEARPRLSALRYAPPRKLTGLPPRSAVIAFSAEKVYALAERLRARHGGTAVVLGALSPRARNAQIDLYESGRVAHLVATDAIGMGLNLTIDHVAFTALRKYDGAQARALAPAEVGQIAGRAGRFRNDGTFGATTELGALDAELVRAVEEHRFPPLTHLSWRSSHLVFDTVDTLLESLAVPSPRPWLVRTRDAEDHRTLLALLDRPDVRDRARGSRAVALLWEVACVPDFSKSLTTDHVDRLAEVYAALVDRGAVEHGWVEARIRRLRRTEGDFEILMARIAAIRTWTFLANRAGWLENAAGWQQETQRIEDALSDALHERLTQRFVDARTGVHFDEPTEEVPVTAQLTPDRFSVDAELRVRCDTHPVARLVAGSTLIEPEVRPMRGASFDLRALEPALLTWRTSWLAPLTRSLEHPKLRFIATPALRGLLHALRGGLGWVPRATIATSLDALDDAERRLLHDLGVEVGRVHVWSTPLLAAPLQPLKGLLWAIAAQRPAPAPPGDVARFSTHEPSDWARALGYVPRGREFVRVDVWEREDRAAARNVRPAPKVNW